MRLLSIFRRKPKQTDVNALPREFLIPDEKAIRAVVKARKGATNIPGVRVFSRKNLAARAG